MHQPLRPDNLISDLENAIAARSGETAAMLHQLTNLFLLNTGHYSADQVVLYDDVFQTLITKVEVAARAKLAQRLAPLDDAPLHTVQSLALDDAIEVAEPVLSQSNTLNDETLIECIDRNSQAHLLAIAVRKQVSERVTDRLIEEGDNKVLGVVANNAGAAISNRGFGILVDKSADDDWLSEAVASRDDIPDHHFRELVSRASVIVQQRLMAKNPQQSETIKRVFSRDLPASESKQQAMPRDYRTAELVIGSLRLTESVVAGFAKERKLEEIIVSIARLSNLSTIEIERLFLGPWGSPVAVVLKAIGFQLMTLDAIYRARLKVGEPIRDDLNRAKAEFIALRRATAERIMRFYRTRKAVEKPHGTKN